MDIEKMKDILKPIFYKIFCVIALGAYSCGCQNNNLLDDLDNNSISFIREIPQDVKGKNSNVYSFVLKMADKLMLPRLDNGFDPIQIRVWQTILSTDSNKLFYLKREGDHWVAGIYYSSFKPNIQNSDIIDTLVIANHNLVPKSGWNPFINDLSNLKIKELPDMDSLPENRYLIMEGDVYTVEVATKNKYRLYTYVNPSNHQNEWWQAKNMVKILHLINVSLRPTTSVKIKQELIILWFKIIYGSTECQISP